MTRRGGFAVGSGWSKRAQLLIAALVAGTLAPRAYAQLAPRSPADPPPLAEPAAALLKAPYLTEQERRDLRIFHGTWTEADLDTPARRARAALIAGALDDPALRDPAAPLEDRAEGAVRRGELETALEMLKDAASIRAVRLRAEALEALGRTGEAAQAIAPLEKRLAGERLTTADDLVEGVRALIVRSRVRAQDLAAGGDFHTMLGLLARARSELDRLHWPAYAVEAELLFDKDNRQQASEAAMQALALNPRSAGVWELMGRAAVDGFNIEGAEQIAARLRDLGGPESAGAAVVLARARLRQGDAEGAVEALGPALERYPQMRRLLAMRAAGEAQRYAFDNVDRMLAEFDRLSPGSFEGYFQVGRTLAEARQYEESRRYLTEAVARAPYRAEPSIELGLMLMQAGRDAEAAQVLSKAVALDPFNTRAGNSLKLVQELLTHPSVESEHFIVRYKPGADEVLAREMPALLEAMHRRVTGSDKGGIEHEPEGRTLIDLMPDHRAFAVRIAGITRIHTMAAATGPLIAMESPREGAGHSIGAYDWLRVVRHEYTHTVTLSRTKNRIPHWFTEAAAVYLEDSPRDYSTCELLRNAYEADELFDLSEINLGFIRPRRPQDRALAYAQGHWMYEFIVSRWGHRAPLELMDLYAAGRREAEAMREVLGAGPAEFFHAFRPWAEAQMESWGMRLGAGVPSIRELLTREAGAEETGRLELRAALERALDETAWGAVAGSAERAEWQPALPRPDDAMIARWLEEYPDHPDILEIAVKRALAGNEDPAPDMVPLLERYAAARPVDPMPHKLLARLYLSGRVAGAGADAAIAHLEFLDAREQRSSAYAIELARRYAASQQLDKAVAKARRAVVVAPFDASNRELLAGIAIQAGDFDLAIRSVEALITIEPDREIHRRRLDAVRKLAEARAGAG